MVELTANLWVGVESLGVDSEITALRMEFCRLVLAWYCFPHSDGDLRLGWGEGGRGERRDGATGVGKGWGRRRTDDYGRIPLLRLGVVIGLRRANGALARLGDVSQARSYDGRDIARGVHRRRVECERGDKGLTRTSLAICLRRLTGTGYIIWPLAKIHNRPE